MNELFSVIVKGAVGPLTEEMIFVYDRVTESLYVREDGKDLQVIWGGLELFALPLQDERDLLPLLTYLAGLYDFVVIEELDVEAGLRVFVLGVRV